MLNRVKSFTHFRRIRDGGGEGRPPPPPPSPIIFEGRNLPQQTISLEREFTAESHSF